jgi:diguanylate cyclase (GGDEF)-like protein
VELGDDLERCHTLDDVSSAAVVHFVGRLGAIRAAILVYGPSGCSGAATAGTTAVLVRTRAADIDREEIGSRLAALLSSPRDWLLSAVLPDASNVVIVPLEADGARLGVVAVEFGPERAALRRDELALIEQSVARIGLSARAVQLLAEVESLATSDPLTGLPNRRLFDDTLDREIARARRSGNPLAVAMLDVDHFKVVNDRHGHQVGDEVLRQLARALENAARRESLIARYGGEEFVVLLPDATSADAVIAAERMRAAAADVGAVAVTVSVGVAARDGDEGPEELLAAADAALYEAKRRGRDRVVSHDALPEPGAHLRPTVSATEGGAGP